jgi:imidazolonepropionase-like amidohydrolase
LLAVHAHGAQAIVDALEVGVDSIEHCTFFTADGVASDPDVLERLARSSTVISATAANLPGMEIPIAAIGDRRDAILGKLATLRAKGARIVCSSDAGIAPIKPHDVLPHGVTRFLPMLGLTNAEAIINVTAFAADVCGIAHLTGTLEPGKDADVVAVAGNPIDDLGAIHDVVAVFARGQRAPTTNPTK